MGIISSIGDVFRKSGDLITSAVGQMDPHKLYAPIINAQDHVTAAKQALDKGIANTYSIVFWNSGPKKHINRSETSAVAYQNYYAALPSTFQIKESKHALSVLRLGLDAISDNLSQIEDNFPKLFGFTQGNHKAPDSTPDIRVSTLMLFGYLEMVNRTMGWIGQLLEVISAKDTSMIPPYWMKQLVDNAGDVGTFITSNLNQWAPQHQGLLGTIKTLQKKGSDIAVQTGNQFIDDYISDRMFSEADQSLMAASIRNPFLIFASQSHAAQMDLMELYTSRKDWLIAKMALEQAKLADMDPNSPEYKRIEKIANNYMALVSKQERNLERLGA